MGLPVILLLTLCSLSFTVATENLPSQGPMFHYVFETCEKRVNHYLFQYFKSTLVRLVNISVLAYDTDNPQLENGSKIVIALTDDLIFWSKAYIMPNLNDSELIYPLMDLNATSQVGGNNSALLFAIENKKKSEIFFQTYQVQVWRPAACPDCLESNAPLPYISVMRDEPNKNWLSINDKGYLIASKDGKQWDNYVEIKHTVPNYRYVEEIFSISEMSNASNVKWVLYLKEKNHKENYYYVASIQNGIGLQLESPKVTFDHGRDFNELAIDTGDVKDEYGPNMRLAVGSVIDDYTGSGKKDKCKYRHIATSTRILTLKKVDGDYLLYQQAIPFKRFIRSNLTLKPNITTAVFEQGKSLSACAANLINVASQNFVMNATINFTPGSKFGFEILSDGVQKTVISFNSDGNILTVDRSKSSNKVSSNNYNQLITAEVYPVTENKIFVEIIVDGPVVEVNVNKITAVTFMVFPNDDSNAMSVFARDGLVTVNPLAVYLFSLDQNAKKK